MKLTKSTLKTIIKEEIESLKELISNDAQAATAAFRKAIPNDPELKGKVDPALALDIILAIEGAGFEIKRVGGGLREND